MLLGCHHDAREKTVVEMGYYEYALCDLCCEDPDRTISLKFSSK